MNGSEARRPPDWDLRRDRITIITGPPGAGKTMTAIRERREGDIIIDFDYIADALTLHGRPHEDHSDVFSTAKLIRDTLIDAIADGSLMYSRAFIIASDTSAAERIRRKTGGKILTVNPGIKETLRRIEADDSVTVEEKASRKDAALAWYYRLDAKKKR